MQKSEYRAIHHHDILTVYSEMPADLETPVTAYLKLARRSPYAFLFESVDRVEKWGRYSFIGADPDELIVAAKNEVQITRGRTRKRVKTDTPLLTLKQYMSSLCLPRIDEFPPFQGGYVGYFAYDCARFFERLPATLPLSKETPDFLFMRVMSFVVFDNLLQKMMIVVHVPIGKDPRGAEKEGYQKLKRIAAKLMRPLSGADKVLKRAYTPGSFKSECSESEYMALVDQVKAYIRAGDVFQCVLSMAFEAKGGYDPVSLYRLLRTMNPSPYLYLLKLNHFSIVGSSPEIMVRKEGTHAIVRPIAGTRRRGDTAEKDAALEQELRNDPKENAEHIMLVDLGRNDLGRVCTPGSVRVTEARSVERYSHVMHLVSSVSGILKDGITLFDLLAATFPAGTLSGAPKIRAMQIIEELEKSRRGIYGGSVGYIGFNGDMDMAITIRTLVVHPNRVIVRAGAGIVADSVPKLEHDECWNKARALMKVCEQLRKK